MHKRAFHVIFLSGVVAMLAFAGYQAGKKVFLNGQLVSSDARVVGGKTYIPLADAAKALQTTVKPRGDGGFDLVPAGGATMVATKLVGEMGEEVMTGKWKFAVLGIERMKQRDPVYLPKESYNHIDAQGGQELIVLKCRFKNATKAKDGIVLASWEGNNTALTTPEEQSFQPHRKGYDAVFNEHFPDGAKILPAAALDFYLIFEVPQGTKVKDLVFTFVRYDVRATFDQKKEAPVDVRIHLKEGE